MSEHVLSILVKAVGAAQASKDLKGIDATVSSIGSRTGKGLRTLGNNLKSAFTTPVGLLGITGGMFALEHVLSDSITKAQDFGSEVSRMQAVTGLTAETTSHLAAALEHFGLSSDKALQSVGMLEKNVGNLTSKGTLEASFVSKFGFGLRTGAINGQQFAKAMSVMADKASNMKQKVRAGALIHKYNNQQVKDANQLLLDSADYFNNKAIPAQTKAAALSKLYGKSWQQLVPFLKAGSQGIKDAEAEADRLGLTLSGSNIEALKKNKEATREWNTALGGLELQIGLKLIPYMTTLAETATKFVEDHGSDITGFFDDAATFAGQLADAVNSYVIPAFQTIGAAWEKVPPDLKKLLITGFVANKLTGGAITGIVGDLGKGLIKGVLGMNAGVVNINAGVVNGGGGKGMPNVPGGPAAGGAAAGEGGLAALGLTATTLGLLGAGIGAAAVAAVITDQRINDKGGLVPAMKPITDAGLTLSPNLIVKDPTLNGTRVVAYGKGGGLIINPNINTRTGAPVTTPGQSATSAAVDNRDNARHAKDMAGDIKKGVAPGGAVPVAIQRQAADERTGLTGVSNTARSGLAGVAAATHSGTSQVMAALAALRLTTNVQVFITAGAVTKAVVKQNTYGASGGDADNDSRHHNDPKKS